MMVVICDYCQNPARKVKGVTIYGHRLDLKNKVFWFCDEGHEAAYVGCHDPRHDRSLHGDTPLGRLADSALRAAKSSAHRSFDPLWAERHGFLSRRVAYGWLAGRLNIKPDDCHIGMFDVETCYRVAAICDAVTLKEDWD